MVRTYIESERCSTDHGIVVFSFEKSLSFAPSHSRRERISKVAKQLPTLIVNCLNRAGQIGVAMEGRGYGTVLPRSVATPVEFTQRDIIVAIAMVTFLIGRLFIV